VALVYDFEQTADMTQEAFVASSPTTVSAVGTVRSLRLERAVSMAAAIGVL
jgi:hypothetical protein